jgi:hypothetical protein
MPALVAAASARRISSTVRSSSPATRRPQEVVTPRPKQATSGICGQIILSHHSCRLNAPTGKVICSEVERYAGFLGIRQPSRRLKSWQDLDNHMKFKYFMLHS